MPLLQHLAYKSGKRLLSWDCSKESALANCLFTCSASMSRRRCSTANTKSPASLMTKTSPSSKTINNLKKRHSQEKGIEKMMKASTTQNLKTPWSLKRTKTRMNNNKQKITKANFLVAEQLTFMIATINQPSTTLMLRTKWRSNPMTLIMM